jgi:hypothetical protein
MQIIINFTICKCINFSLNLNLKFTNGYRIEHWKINLWEKLFKYLSVKLNDLNFWYSIRVLNSKK